MNAIELLHNKHMIYWSSFLALIDSPQWRHNHPTNKALFHRNMIRRFSVGRDGGDKPASPTTPPQDFGIEHVLGMVNEAKSSDPDIQYTEENLKWLLGVFETRNTMALTFMWMRSVTPFEYLTPVEAAERTNTAESGWRNKCANGEIEGATKKGKQWLIPEYVLTVKYPENRG